MSQLTVHRSTATLIDRLVVAFVIGLLALMCLATYNDALWLLLLPATVLTLAAILLDYRLLYYGFFALVPFSVEIYLPGGLGTDLPTEPLMIALTGVCIALAVTRWREIDYRYLWHPLTALILLHVGWIALASILSSHPVVSYKYLLAKIWYVVPFYGLSIYLIQDRQRLRLAMKLMTISLVISVSIVLVRFIPYSLEFKDIEKVMNPFFRNHVNYASIMAAALPWIWALFKTSSKAGKKWLLVTIAFLVFATLYSYTRAAILSMPIAVIMYYIIRLKKLRFVIAGGLVAAILLIGYVATDRTWLDFAPDFDKTITHQSFDDLIAATAKGEDISTMERVYRWVAAGHMIAERPIVGFGPGTFYRSYRPYTVTSFETFVSDNPQKSGIHSYYLMTWVDQGTVGMLLFIALALCVLIYGEYLYHRLANETDRVWLMAALLCLLVLDAILVINDMLEVDKTGPLYFLAIAVVTTLSVQGKKIPRHTINNQ